jgi:phosphoribosylformimino-5-aminoimidazole carboxamide ribotide isomerase
MLVIPRLELRNGACVRPCGRSGERTNGATPIGDALEAARSWAVAGFRRIHLVDRDAMSGSNTSKPLVDEIVRDGAIEVQVDDAADTGEEIDRLVSAGAVRVVLGSRWLNEPEWLASTADLYPGLLVVSAEMRDRRIVTRERGRIRSMAALDVVADLSGVPLGGVLVSSAADGHRSTLDLSLIEDIADASDVPVMVEGGVHAMSDLRALEHRGASVVLLGESLNRGDLDAPRVALEFGDS